MQTLGIQLMDPLAKSLVAEGLQLDLSQAGVQFFNAYWGEGICSSLVKIPTCWANHMRANVLCIGIANKAVKIITFCIQNQSLEILYAPD